jgi:hypothetical protein
MHHSKRRTIRSGTCSSDRQGPRRPYMTTKRDRMMQTTAQPLAMIRTNIPFRLDRLPWSRFHLLVVIGLGITWILDGLEVTIVGSLGPALQRADTLHLSSANLGAVASFYVVGAVVGALVFGWIPTGMVGA